MDNRRELDVILFLRNKTSLFLRVKSLWPNSKISCSAEWSPLHIWDYGVVKLWCGKDAITPVVVDVVGGWNQYITDSVIYQCGAK